MKYAKKRKMFYPSKQMQAWLAYSQAWLQRWLSSNPIKMED